MAGRAVAMESAGSRMQPRFFVWTVALCVFFAGAGFTPTYLGPLATGSLGTLPAAVHIHGLLFFSWTLLLLLQTSLVARGRVSTHRSIGLGAIAVATAMVIFGFIVSLSANAERMTAGEVGRAYALGFSNSVALIAFACMFGLAIAKRRSPEAHKRLMLFATCMILTPAVGRLYRPVFAPSQPPPWLVFVTIDTILVGCLVHDWRSRRRLHPVTVASGSVLVAFQVLRFPLPQTAWWQATYDAFLGLLR